MALEDWVGRRETVEDVVTAFPLRALAAALYDDESNLAVGAEVAPLRHWLFCKEVVAGRETGTDGHPRRGRFLPPVELPRRMWAGSRVLFHEVLHLGDAIRRESEILSVVSKEGRSGRLVFVTVRHRVFGPSGLSVDEEQDLVCREPPQPGTASSAAEASAAADWAVEVTVDPVALFRFSALIFNGHRIHYDRPYAVAEEGYEGLVVQGPLTALLLLDLCRERNPDRRVREYVFRAVSPLFDTAPFTIAGRRLAGGASCELWAEGRASRLAMSATATFA